MDAAASCTLTLLLLTYCAACGRPHFWAAPCIPTRTRVRLHPQKRGHSLTRYGCTKPQGFLLATALPTAEALGVSPFSEWCFQGDYSPRGQILPGCVRRDHRKTET